VQNLVVFPVDRRSQCLTYFVLGGEWLANGPGDRLAFVEAFGQGQGTVGISREDGNTWFIRVTKCGDLVQWREVPQIGRQGTTQAIASAVSANLVQFVVLATFDGLGSGKQAQATGDYQPVTESRQANVGATVLGGPAMRPGNGIGIEQAGAGRIIPPFER
jgi:hypothetical protein